MFFAIALALLSGPDTGRVELLPLHTDLVADRTIEVRLPPGYDAAKTRRYPVIYMHDGQNVLRGGNAFGGKSWRAGAVLDSLVAAKAAAPAIIVAVYNTPARFREYFPQGAFQTLSKADQDTLAKGVQGGPLADAYTAYLATRVVPEVDAKYRTIANADARVVIGSSMGGLISLYTFCKYPGVFARAACLSTHWPGVMVQKKIQIGRTLLAWYGDHLPPPDGRKLYLDAGDQGLDAYYGPYQPLADSMLTAHGYPEGPHRRQRFYPGAGHSEASWASRLGRVFAWILPPTTPERAAKAKPVKVDKHPKKGKKAKSSASGKKKKGRRRR